MAIIVKYIYDSKIVHVIRYACFQQYLSNSYWTQESKDLVSTLTKCRERDRHIAFTRGIP